MNGALRKLKTWMIDGLSLLKTNCLFFLLIVPIHAIYLGVARGHIWSVAVNCMTLSIIFSSAMRFRSYGIILKDIRENRILDDL